MSEQASKQHRHGSWAWLLAVPPAMALIGGVITLYIVIKYPDHAIAVESTSDVRNEHGNTHQHVVNSVTPPLK